MRTVSFVLAALVAFGLAQASAAAGEKKPTALSSPPVSLNPADGQVLCLVSNISANTTVSVTVEIIDGTGLIFPTATLEIPPGRIDAAGDLLTSFYSYCRVTPANPEHLPLLRASHCAVTSNSVKACLEAR